MFRTLRVLVLGAALAVSLVAAPQFVPAASAAPSKEQWLKDVGAAMSGGTSYLDSRKNEGGSKLAVVLDIDNTALASHYGGGATGPVRDFARHAADKGYAVLFVTGRPSSRESESRTQLSSAGYAVDGLCLSDGSSLSSSKQRCRQSFADQGYTITENVGHNSTDFTGGDYERRFELPNYDGTLS